MNSKKIALNLHNLRYSKQMNQDEMAELIGVSRSTVAMYETGKRIPNDEVKIRIAKAFDTSVESIFFS